MRLMIVLFVLIGLIGAVMLLMDEDRNLLGLWESSLAVKKFKQEEEAFEQFCKDQNVRDEAKKLEPVQVKVASPAQNTALPAQSSAVSFDKHPFGKIDFHHIGELNSAVPVNQAIVGPVTQSPASAGNMSQAQQMQSSSNPIINTWAGYVSQIEAAEK